MVIRGLHSADPAEPGMLPGLQGRTWERHQQKWLVKPRREGWRVGGRELKVREELGWVEW